MRSSTFLLPCFRHAWICLLLVAACAPSMETRQLDALRALGPEAGDFRQSLASEYLAYAEAEKEGGEARDAEYFALKGLTAVQGQDVFPDAPQDRRLAPADQSALNAAHDWLLSSLQPVREHTIPELLARAQLMFDCWLDNAEEGKSADDVKVCREAFEQARSDIADQFPDMPLREGNPPRKGKTE